MASPNVDSNPECQDEHPYKPKDNQSEEHVYCPVDESCDLCQQGYRDPRLLPCHDSFCLRCLEEYFSSPDTEKRCCPRCSQEVSLPEGGACQLWKATSIARYMHSVMTQKMKEGSLLCDRPSCRKETKRAVTYCSRQCGLLCSDCSRQHSESVFTQNHKEIATESMMEMENWVENISAPYCKERGHENSVTEQYCETHKQPICKQCIQDDKVHLNCYCKMIWQKAEYVRQELHTLITEIESHAASFSSVLESLCRDHEENISGIKSLELKIVTIAQRLHSEIDQARNKLLAQTNEITHELDRHMYLTKSEGEKQLDEFRKLKNKLADTLKSTEDCSLVESADNMGFQEEFKSFVKTLNLPMISLVISQSTDSEQKYNIGTLAVKRQVSQECRIIVKKKLKLNFQTKVL